MVCLDTDILVGLLRGDGRAIGVIEELQRRVEPLKTTIITAYELLKGAASSSKPRENMRLVKEMLSNINILTLSYGACEEASRIYVKLRRRGITIGEFDLLIAAIAIHNDELLISRDKHFKLIEELKLETW